MCLQTLNLRLCLLGALVSLLSLLYGDLSQRRLAFLFGFLLQRRLPFLNRLLCSESPRYLWLALLLGPPLRGLPLHGLPLRGLLLSLYFGVPLLLGLSLCSGLLLGLLSPVSCCCCFSG
jgi:hypothetical protein